MMIVAAAAAFASCSKEHDGIGGQGSASLQISAESLTVFDAETRAGQIPISSLGVTADRIPTNALELRTLVACADLTIRLEGSDSYKVWTSANAFNSENMELMPATYYIKLGQRQGAPVNALPHYTDLATGATVSNVDAPYHNGGRLVPQVPEGVNMPYFEGSAEVTLERRQEATAQVTVKAANAVVCVEFTDAFKRYFAKGATFTLQTKAGNSFTVSYTGDGSGDGAVQYNKQYYWVRPQGLTISGTAMRQDPSPGIVEAKPVKIADYVVADADVLPQTLYTYTLDIKNVGGTNPDKEGNGITITVNNNPVETFEEDIELNPNV